MTNYLLLKNLCAKQQDCVGMPARVLEFMFSGEQWSLDHSSPLKPLTRIFTGLHFELNKMVSPYSVVSNQTCI